MNGYGGNILLVNLSNRTVLTTPLDPQFAKKWIGGRGFAASLLYYQVGKDAAPFDPENAVVMASGPLSGTFVPAAGKVHFATKSPETGGYGDSNMGGHIAAEMKYAGFDAIIITGKAKKPSYIFIEDGKVGIRSAAKLWGRSAIETEKNLKEELGDEFQIAAIGPAGEHCVPFACISHDFGRQAGRTGIGAVLGSKNIKAIAIRGTKSIPIADMEAMIVKGKKMFADCKDSPDLKHWQKYGTPGVVTWVNRAGALPVRNFQTEYLEEIDGLSAETMRREIVLHDKACFSCPMSCGKYSKVEIGESEFYVEGPEYETIALCGSNCGFTDINDVAYANWLCDQYGLDTISTGGVIAFAIECFQKVILTKRHTDGRELKWGDRETFKYLVEKITYKDGFIGNLLSNGVRAAAEYLKHGSEDFAIQVKGLEWSGYGSRWAPAMALSYMTCDVGSHHSRSWAITHDMEKGRDVIEGKAERVVYLQHIRPMFDMLGVCRLLWVELGLEVEHYPQILKTVTGLDYSIDDLLKASERVWNLTRAFWFREVDDFGRNHDMPPGRFLKEPVPTGEGQGKILTKEQADWLLNEYYKLRGWDENGKPIKEKLEELDLGFLIPDLY